MNGNSLCKFLEQKRVPQLFTIRLSPMLSIIVEDRFDFVRLSHLTPFCIPIITNDLKWS